MTEGYKDPGGCPCHRRTFCPDLEHGGYDEEGVPIFFPRRTAPETAPRPEVQRAVRIAFDIGGVLSKFPETCRAMIAALIAGGAEVFILTDMHVRGPMLDMLRRNGIVPPVPEANVHTADYARHGEACKAVLLRDLGIDVLIDDFGGYVAWPWPTPAPMRLLVSPDTRRPYYSPTWETDGSEGDFGRRAYYEG